MGGREFGRDEGLILEGKGNWWKKKNKIKIKVLMIREIIIKIIIIIKMIIIIKK